MKHEKKTKASWKRRYARAASEEEPIRPSGTDSVRLAKSIGYSAQEIRSVPESALTMGLGCGNPTALAELKKGETVLDLGSGGGLDVFLAARKVGKKGTVIGVDMTPEMIEKSSRAAAEGGYENVEFRLGEIENLPVADESIDAVISNCVVSHSPDKPAVFREAFRVLRPGGRMLVSDLVTVGRLPRLLAPGSEIWAQWLAGAPRKREYLKAMRQAGFMDVAIVAEHPFDYPVMDDALRGKIVSLQVRAYK